MKTWLCATATGVAVFAFAAGAMAGPSAQEQTSAQQARMCDHGLQTCTGGDQAGCVTAMKTCVGEKRQKVMKLMEAD